MTALKNLFQVAAFPMWVFDTKSLNFLAVNSEMVRCCGYTERELLNMSITQLYTDEDEWGRARLEKKNGDSIYLRMQYSLTDHKGTKATLVMANDVTVDVHTLKDSEINTERYNIIAKATSDTIWDWSLATDTIYWNRGIKGIFGHRDLINYTSNSEWWRVRIHPDDRDRVWHNINNHIINRIARWQDEYRFACADGTYRYVHDRGFMVFEDGNMPTRIIGSMQDISRRKEEEQWSRLLESVVINAMDAVQICTGEEGGQKIIYVNEAFIRMSGYEKTELIGASPKMSYGPDTDPAELQKIKEAFTRKATCEVELINYTKSGQEYWVSQSHAPISDHNGAITHWICIQRDITQNKMHLREIEEQNAKFREIAWIQSHLVRAPLARVMALVDLVKNYEPGDDMDELLVHLTNSAKELDSIIINIADKTPS